MTAVRTDDLVVRHGPRRILGPVSLDVPGGGAVGVRGPSGAGKSTLLRALVGLLPPELRATGCISVLGVDVTASGTDLPGLRSRATLVGQVPVVFPQSVLANALFGARHVVRASRAALRERAEAALVEAGLWPEVEDRLDAPASELSIGQRQRLCLARALALDPEVLLLDEPTSALDTASTATVEAAITALRGHRTLVVVSHDGAQLGRLCDAVVDLPAPGDPSPTGAEPRPAGLGPDTLSALTAPD